MPIPVTRIKEALRPLQERIYGVLASDPENAYGPEEIYVAVTGRDSLSATAGMSESQRDEHFATWMKAIKELVVAGRIEHATLDGKNYWFVKADGS